MAWLIYALGGGWGHFQRGLALARRAAARGIAVALLTNCRQREQIVSPGTERWTRGVELLWIDADLAKEQTISRVRAAIESRPWEAVVVDAFPRGLSGELAEIIPTLHAFRVWVHRDLTPEYVAWAKLPEFAQHFDLVLVPGENAPLGDLPQAVRTEPWLLADEHELLSRDAARAKLGLPAGDQRPIVLVSAAGMPDEQSLFADIAQRLAAEVHGAACVLRAGAKLTSTAVPSLAHWPLVELIRGVDVLVGAGGYHTVHEARAAGVPLLALPQPRLYDRQDRRLRADEGLTDSAAISAQVRACLGQRRSAPGPWPRGVDQALEHILKLLPCSAPRR